MCWSHQVVLEPALICGKKKVFLEVTEWECVEKGWFVFAERFQLVAVHLPQSGDQMVEAQELSAVLSGVNPNPAAIAFGRGVRTCRHSWYQELTTST